MMITFKIVSCLLVMCGVFSAETDEVKTVMEGDSVTVNPDLTQIQGINMILWRFGDTGFTIAQVEENEISYDPDERFRDRLKLDQTGSLTITNMRIKHSGLYKAEIIHNTGTTYSKFTVIVYESPAVIEAFKGEMKSVSETEGESVTLQTDVTETHGDELIAWRFGDEGKLIAKHDLEAKSPPLYDPDERLRDRLKLDHQTGSLTITNTRTTDSGLYTVKISSSKQTLYKRFTVTVSVPGLSPGTVTGIVFGVVLLVLSAAAGVFYHRLKVSELQKKIMKISKHLEQLPEISKQLEQLTKTSENELTKISEQELSEISDKLKRMSEIFEQEMPKISEHLKQLLKISEHLKQLRNKVTNQETTRSDLERGGEERCIIVQDTAISRATGDDKTSTEEQGKKISIRKNSSEDAGVHTHGTEVTNQETTRSDLERGGEERCITVHDTAISQATGDDKTPTEVQSKRIPIRKNSSEDAGVHTPDPTETVVTPLLKEHDGENKPEDTTPG